MEINFDETLLLSQRVDPSFDEPVLHQVLRIAVYDEYHAYETYMKVINTFGEQKPFTNIIEAEVMHYSMLIPLLEKYEVPVPIDNWYERVELPATFVECCELGVAAEIKNIRMYDDLLLYVDSYPDVKEVLYRLQAASYNNHLPAFRKCVSKHNTSSSENILSEDEMSQKVNEFTQMAQKLVSGEMSQEEMMKMLGSTNMSFLGGILAGGLGAAFLPKLYNKENDTKD